PCQRLGFFFQAEDGIRDRNVTGVQTCALPISMVVTLDAKRRLTVPVALAPAKPGDYFDARFDPEEDAIVFRRLGGQESWLTVMKIGRASCRERVEGQVLVDGT